MVCPKRVTFPRSLRLRRASEFNLVKTAGKSWTGRYLVVAVLKRTNADSSMSPAKIGIITSRRVGPAVIRNRIRRRIREIFRYHQHQIQQGTWIVTIARASATKAAFAELEQDWLRLLGRASILAPG
jgi:ribonuclease P protein component